MVSELASGRDPNQAEYADGRTAARHTVSLTFHPEGLSITGATARTYWPLEGLVVLDAPDNEFGIRLGHDDHDGARLILDSSLLIGQFHERYPDFMKRRQDGRRYDLRRAGWATGIMVVLAAIFFLLLPNIVLFVSALIPYSVEKSIGDSARNSFSTLVSGADRQCIETRGRAALEIVVKRITDGYDLNSPINVQVAPSPMVNAVAFPGGDILVFDGLIEQAKSPEEVAGVIAHEIGHAHHRHGVQRMVRDSAVDALISVFAPGSAGDMGASLGSALLSQSYGRDAEREADRFAIERFNEIGVRTMGMAEFFERMERQYGSGGDSMMRYFASHPLSVERANEIRSGGTGTNSILTEAQWQDLRNICSQTE